jgi:hypothetical protein
MMKPATRPLAGRAVPGIMCHMLEAQSLSLVHPATVHLRLAQPIAADDPGAEAALMGAAELPWLGEAVDRPAAGGDVPSEVRRFQADLGLPASSGSSRLVFRKAAYVDLGRVERVPGGWRMSIGWRAASLAPLFPVFGGQLTRTPGTLVLEGEYAPPGGELGAAVDRALLNIAARKTAVWVLGLIAGALDSAASRSASLD